MEKDTKMENYFLDVRAIAHKLGERTPSSLRRAFLLVTLYTQYISELYKNRETVERHDSYIVRTLEGLSVLTGASEEIISEDLAFFEGRYLIKYKKGFGIRYQVNLERYKDFIEEARDEYTSFKESRFKEIEKKRKRTSNALKDIADMVTRIILEVDPTDLESLKKAFGEANEDDAWLMYLFTYYYKRYTGEDYVWTLPKLNALKSGWEGSLYKRYAEFGLSRALKLALETKGNRHLEKVWCENFNGDFNTDPYDPFHPITDVLDDGLMK